MALSTAIARAAWRRRLRYYFCALNNPSQKYNFFNRATNRYSEADALRELRDLRE